MIFSRIKGVSPRAIIHTGTALFTLCIALAYALYPHWVTLSHFAEQWYTLIPYTAAMVVALAELGYVAHLLRQCGSLIASSNMLYASTCFIALVICIPYLGTPLQKDIHNIVALAFAVSATVGFAILAKRIANVTLWMLSSLIFGICILEVFFLARYAMHPVYPWVWTVLELTAIALLIISLDVITVVLRKTTQEQEHTSPAPGR